MQNRKYLLIALISLTLIPLELAWTRIFSAEFFYTFAFLILSLAILGLGLGALALRLFKGLNRPSFMGFYLFLTGLLTITGPILVFKISPDFSVLFSSPTTAMNVALVILILMSVYFTAGVALAMLFKKNHRDISRLYMVDLIAAGIGVIIGIGLMNNYGTPAASFLIAVPVLLASLIDSRGAAKLLPVVAIAGLFFLVPRADNILELNRPERAPVIYRHWDAMSKIKVYDFGPGYRGLNIDNIANSPVYEFDGNFDDTKPGETPWGINVSNLIQRFDSCVFLSLGAGGGSDVLQALVEGATEVHAVEINRHINKMMIDGDPSGYFPPPPDTVSDSTSDSTIVIESTEIVTMPVFSGMIYHDPRVTVATEDARTYVKRFRNKFDVIYSLSSNTWAALASGSFALSENYLFTTEAFQDYWQALSDSGFMMMEHQVYMPRLVSEVIEALKREEVAEPIDHFAVYDLPQMRRKIVLISKQPLDDSTRYYALGELTPEKFDQIHLLFPTANDSLSDNLINRIIEEGWRRRADSAKIDLSPVSDDRPFVAQLGLWKNLNGESLDKVIPYAEFRGFPLSSLVMVIILVIVIVIVIPLNLIPFFRSGPNLKIAPWLYFFAIGAAFMAVEIVLIQKYALLVGASLYSFVTVLLTLLVASGIGSRFSEKISANLAFPAIIFFILIDAFLMPAVISMVGGASLAVRIAVTAAIVCPLGFFMGMPFPKATRRVGELVDWGFAVNGAASVMGSILILLAVFAWGFSTGLALAALVYMAAFLLYRRSEAW